MTLQELARIEGLVTMPKKDYVKEHKNLIKVLRKGSPAELKREANKQAKELRGSGEDDPEGAPDAMGDFNHMLPLRMEILRRYADNTRGDTTDERRDLVDAVDWAFSNFFRQHSGLDIPLIVAIESFSHNANKIVPQAGLYRDGLIVAIAMLWGSYYPKSKQAGGKWKDGFQAWKDTEMARFQAYINHGIPGITLTDQQILQLRDATSGTENPDMPVLPPPPVDEEPEEGTPGYWYEGSGKPSGGIAPFLCRVGSKKRFAELLNFIAPPHHTYVEPFVGSGAFYWQKEPSTKEVVNDLDKDIARTFQMIKKAPTNLSLYPQNLQTKEQLKKWFLAHQNSRSIATQLVYQIIHHCGGWMGKQVNEKTGNVVRSINPFNKLKHIAEYKARMANTTVKSEDYAKLLKTYDGKDTFIFLDPPYENSSGLGYAQGLDFDFERLRKSLDGVKGHWLMTINDSPRIRQLFKGYTINPIIIKGHKANRVGDAPGRRHIGSTDRPELLISNYPLPRGWREHTGKSIK